MKWLAYICGIPSFLGAGVSSVLVRGAASLSPWVGSGVASGWCFGAAISSGSWVGSGFGGLGAGVVSPIGVRDRSGMCWSFLVGVDCLGGALE